MFFQILVSYITCKFSGLPMASVCTENVFLLLLQRLDLHLLQIHQWPLGSFSDYSPPCPDCQVRLMSCQFSSCSIFLPFWPMIALAMLNSVYHLNSISSISLSVVLIEVRKNISSNVHTLSYRHLWGQWRFSNSVFLKLLEKVSNTSLFILLVWLTSPLPHEVNIFIENILPSLLFTVQIFTAVYSHEGKASYVQQCFKKRHLTLE